MGNGTAASRPAWVLGLWCCIGAASAADIEITVDDAALSRMAAAVPIRGSGSYPLVTPRSIVPSQGRVSVEWQVLAPRVRVTPSGVRLQGILQGLSNGRKASQPFDAEASFAVEQGASRFALALRRTSVDLVFREQPPKGTGALAGATPGRSGRTLQPVTVRVVLQNALRLSVPLASPAGSVGGTAMALKVSNPAISLGSGAVVVSGNARLEPAQ